jgi:dienelactone hydrolase
MRLRHAALSMVLLAFLAGRFAAAVPVTGTPAKLAAADGTMLAATYYSGGKPGPGILLCHQCNRDRKAWNGLAEKLARAGFHVLTVDYRGYGESGGKPFLDLPPEERRRISTELWPGDLDVAFKYLRAQPGVSDVIGAGGASCGVNNSIQLARRHPEIKSLVLLSGNSDRAGRQFLGGKSSPPLMIAAADDDGNVVQVMEWIEASSGKSENRFVEYKTGGHGSDLFKPHPDLPGEIVAWYEATLAGKGTPASTDNRARRSSPRVRLLLLADQSGGGAKLVETLTAERKKDPKSPVLQEDIVNTVGYEVLQGGDTKSAVAIMRFNVDGHPTSSNAWDSLGDAYLADGQREKAREASQKSLSLVDSDPAAATEDRRKSIRDSAQAKLDQLKGAAGS